MPGVLNLAQAQRHNAGIGVQACIHQANLMYLSPFGQPSFTPQVFYAWSKRSDAVLEVECTGRWREAYDALRALGVTDQELVGG